MNLQTQAIQTLEQVRAFVAGTEPVTDWMEVPIMGKHERQAYLEAIRGRYRKANRAGKTAVLRRL